MARKCCKYFTVSLVPVASLTLAVLFGLAIVALPVLYVELTRQYRVSAGLYLESTSDVNDITCNTLQYTLC